MRESLQQVLHHELRSRYAFRYPRQEQIYITENDVSSPPALRITDEQNQVWTLGNEYGPAPSGEFAFRVLRDGWPTDYFASRIERRKGKIYIFTATGYKRWTGRDFV